VGVLLPLKNVLWLSRRTLPQKPKVNFQTGAGYWSWTNRKAEGLCSEARGIRRGYLEGWLNAIEADTTYRFFDKLHVFR
jgi:hypothetical protein